MKSDELDDSHLGGVTAARAGLVDAGVTTVAISILGADLVDDLLGDIFLGDVGVDLTLSVQIFLLTMERTSLARVTVVSILPFSNR